MTGGAYSSGESTGETQTTGVRQDLNPGFPPFAGRTPLAKVRTHLSGRRSALSSQRTALAKGRTGLAFFRTGIAMVTIAVSFTRFFGTGAVILTLDLALLAAGVVMILDGLRWYLPVRKDAARNLGYESTPREPGVTVLGVADELTDPRYFRSDAVRGAEQLRAGWNELAPVERRRFLANDRTDMAEDRTAYASLRTIMAKTRIGLAFTRSGVAFAGLGLALIRSFPASVWTYFDIFLIVVGSAMALEGFYWYVPGYRAGSKAMRIFRKSLKEKNIWDIEFPPLNRFRDTYPPVKASHAPGVWGTTGLALERTVLAERRNLMSRLRVVMAHSRTGLAFIRTGTSISAVGAGLITFLPGGLMWVIIEVIMVMLGMTLILDGLRWFRVSEKVREQFPYCYGDLEIGMPNYGVPASRWSKVVFSHDDL